MEAWHFVGKTLRDGRPVPADGELLRHDDDLELCAAGLHASERVIDALQYAPGDTLCRVQIGGKIMRGEDKLCATERTILWRIDAEPILFEFSRWAALQVVHLWDCPEMVRKYLETGDPELRNAACAAANAFARAVACDSWDDARDAAWSAAKYAANERDAARVAAREAARYAAWAAESTANAGARNVRATMDAQNERLTAMIIAAHKASL